MPGSAGTCSPVAGDPRGGRPACTTDGTACGGACDGVGRAACAYPGGSTECRAPVCTAGVATAEEFCNGSGRCPALEQSACNAYACGPNACKTSCSTDSDCAADSYCQGGACHTRGDATGWVVAGSGCSAAGPAMWPAILVLAAFLLRRRRGAALAVMLAAAGGARAQSVAFSADRFQPGAGAFDLLGVASADTAQDSEWHLSLHTSYARDPLRLIAVNNPGQVLLLHSQPMLHLGGSIGLWDRFEIGAVLPVAFAQGSEAAPMLGGAAASGVPGGGIGDLRVFPKMRLISLKGLMLGVAAPFTVPIGRQDAYLGSGSPTVTPMALAELTVLPVRLLANAGVAVRSGHALGNLNVGSAMTYGLAGEMPFEVRGQKLAALATLSGEVGLSQGGAVERPMELLAALRWTALRGFDLTAGGGPGLTTGYGTPRYRLFVSFSFTPGILLSRAPHAPPPMRPAVLVVAPPPPPPPPAPPTPPVEVYVAEPPLPEPPVVLAKLEEKTIDLLAPVLFSHDRDRLLPESRAVLDAAAEVLRAHPEVSRVRIGGHTDGHGKPSHNLMLSERRARAVRAYLVKHGVAPVRLESRGFGATQPVDTNDSEVGRARNRRVELVILRRGTMVGFKN
ncbi:MAG TPA: OmpA family protein [Myxococcales bacterium]